MKTIKKVLLIVLLPPYAIAYGISHALKLDGRENMPTIKEWLSMANEN